MSKKLFIPAILLALGTAGFLIGFSMRTVTIAHGCFHQVAHKGRGCATVMLRGDGKTVLQLTDFATSENPDLRVLLISSEDAFENSVVLESERIDLGPLQTAAGSQEYVIPRNVDVTGFRAVTVWSSRHEVNFTTAPLRKF